MNIYFSEAGLILLDASVFFLKVYLCICVSVCGCPRTTAEGTGFPGTVAIAPNMDAENKVSPRQEQQLLLITEPSLHNEGVQILS